MYDPPNPRNHQPWQRLPEERQVHHRYQMKVLG
jgi:hypothetical protein